MSVYLKAKTDDKKISFVAPADHVLSKTRLQCRVI